MKTRFLALIITLFFVSSSIFAQNPLSHNTPFKDWYKNPAVETTYITKAMWDLVPDMKIGNKNIAELQDMLDQVEIYSTSDKRTGNGWRFDTLMNNAINVAEGDNYELIMQLSNDSKQVIFYAKKDDKNKNMFKDLILINTERTSPINGKGTVIRLLGKFLIEDIQDLITIPKSTK